LLVGFSFSFEAEESFKNLYMVGGGPFSFLFFEEKGRRGGEGGFSILLFSGFRWDWVDLFDKETSIVEKKEL